MAALDQAQAASTSGWNLDGAADSPGALPSPPRFSRHHGADRNFFLVYIVLIWLGIVGGFAPQMIKHVQTDAPAYPPILHIHAVAFVGWLVLLTTQVLLIRSARPNMHRVLGTGGAALAAAMIV